MCAFVLFPPRPWKLSQQLLSQRYPSHCMCKLITWQQAGRWPVFWTEGVVFVRKWILPDIMMQASGVQGHIPLGNYAIVGIGIALFLHSIGLGFEKYITLQAWNVDLQPSGGRCLTPPLPGYGLTREAGVQSGCLGYMLQDWWHRCIQYLISTFERWYTPQRPSRLGRNCPYNGHEKIVAPRSPGGGV